MVLTQLWPTSKSGGLRVGTILHANRGSAYPVSPSDGFLAVVGVRWALNASGMKTRPDSLDAFGRGPQEGGLAGGRGRAARLVLFLTQESLAGAQNIREK